MTKIQFGHGGHILEGWLNLEQHQADITKPLAFKDDSVDFIFTEHCVEHVTPQQGYKFLLEAHRILKPHGVIRVIVPDIEKVCKLAGTSESYIAMLKEGIKTWWPAANWKQPTETPTAVDAVETLIFCHGHQAIYNQSLLLELMAAAGFYAKACDYGNSEHPELNAIDSHWKYMGLENCILESCCCEGTK
jgi:SAM-dependent methyltransferase